MKYSEIDRNLRVAKFHHNHSKNIGMEREYLDKVRQNVNSLIMQTR